jgi:uncharacterized protein with HEPN domain
MTRIDDVTRIRHMLDAASRAYTLTEGRERSDLEEDDVLGLAIVRLLEILGEAARGVSSEMQKRHPEIPWQLIVGTRNRVIHAYFNVDMDIVWHILSDDLPSLRHQLEEIMRGEFGQTY